MIEKVDVSVVMTAFNREKFIEEAIQSILNSTYRNFELIIVDDCSTDGTADIARQYAMQDSRIKLFINPYNLGQFRNRNKAAMLATGEWIITVDSDDGLLVDGIEKVMEVMGKFPNSSFGMGYPQGSKCEEVESSKAIRKHLLKQPFLSVGPGGTVIKRSFFEYIKGFPEDLGPSGDMYYNLKAVSMSSVVLLAFDFHFYRFHEGQEINEYNSASNRYLYSNYCYMRDALLNLNLFLTEKEKHWLIKKNNRRFIVNLTKYFFKTFSLANVRKTVLKSNFGFRELISGIFH